jgi:hypothetical protein
MSNAERCRRYQEPEIETQSAFRYLTSRESNGSRSMVRASLEGIARLSCYGDQPLTSCFMVVGPFGAGHRRGEDRSRVAHSPSWRRRYGGRKPPSGVKCPPSSALDPPANSAPPGLRGGSQILAEERETVYIPLGEARDGLDCSPVVGTVIADQLPKARVGVTPALAFLFSAPRQRSQSHWRGRK